MTLYFGVLTFIFGLILGSFLNCTAVRITKKEDWVHGKSHCVKCGHELGARDLIPLFSYIFSKGKCRYCGEKISKRYPITEITFAVLITILYIVYVVSVLETHFNVEAALNVLLNGKISYEQYTVQHIALFIRNTALTGALFILSLVDLDSYEIPDGCIIAGVVAWIVSVPFVNWGSKVIDTVTWAGRHILTGIAVMMIMLLLAILMDKLLKKESLGGGDIKLFGMLGLYLGAAGSYELILFSCIVGLIFAGIRKKLKRDAPKAFPFGPAIAITGYVLLMTAPAITGWYLGLLGI